MTPKPTDFFSLKSWLYKSQQHFALIPILIWLNVATVCILSLLSIYAKLRSKGQNIEILFSDPFNTGIFYLGWLTGISEILWCAAIAICLFANTLFC